MEDLWKLRDMNYRLKDLANRAEYDRLVKRFHQDEERDNMKNLLYGPCSIKKSGPEPPK
ncbi:hypothetical protein DESUT3_06870 [Desulfuromonas versatilis]|uniref:Uncharacterized protein n=1 Tax=Desulfuromonas versatilis TaxID=2802975 RepID=A0ABN6DTZ7_9BACT|nr:hypothetical protein [Desulfuromonas versatilis]BCR03618.1 hypothetical protein DESUT3_06870 [Desulfuromonas versatilis]